MFTGIITDVGTIAKLNQAGDLQARINTAFDVDSIDIGASIACNGVCLTVVTKGIENNQNWFDVEISAESVSITNISKGRKAWSIGQKVNLERALKMGDELGGHIVSGHVDGIAIISDIKVSGDSTVVDFHIPSDLAQFIAQKGSVTLDGTSLTVNDVSSDTFKVNLISHTKDNTTWNDIKVGDKINLEIDTLARYVARLEDVRNSK
ncbi:riboflavin synthase [Amylibacter sp.]|nr:riboflavin synthase [Amylibacter sp.]